MARRKKVIPATIRTEVIARDNERCRACGLRDRDGMQCDHIVPESLGGETTVDNLQALCSTCNNRKGQTDVGELAVRPAVDGFGDYEEVMANRQQFVAMLEATRNAFRLHCESLVAEWKATNTRKLTIRKRLDKLGVTSRTIETLVR